MTASSTLPDPDRALSQFRGMMSALESIPKIRDLCGEALFVEFRALDQHLCNGGGLPEDWQRIEPRPEDNPDWSLRFDARCHLYPGRDCPGCLVRCARTGDLLEDPEPNGPVTPDLPEEPPAT